MSSSAPCVPDATFEPESMRALRSPSMSSLAKASHAADELDDHASRVSVLSVTFGRANVSSVLGLGGDAVRDSLRLG